MCKDTRDYKETTSRARRIRTGGNGVTPENLFDDTVPNTIEPDDAASAGTATTAARIDHEHAIAAGNPNNIEPDDTTWEGNSTTFARSNHRHAIAAASAGTIQCDDSAAEGTSTSFSRADHQHAIVCAVVGTITPDDAAAEGSASSFARSDHTHAITCDTPGTIQCDDGASEGISAYFARADHQHSNACDAPSTNLSALTSNTEGTGVAFARASHIHAITTSSNPGSSIRILATDGSGWIGLQSCTIGSGGIYPSAAKSVDLGTSSREWDNLYYVTANEGTSRIINSSKTCPVCNSQMKKGTGSRVILGEHADYEMVFCLNCGVTAVEEHNHFTPEMLAQRRPPPEVILKDVRTAKMGGRGLKVMVDFDYGDGVENSTRLGDDELAALKGMTPAERKAFLLQLGEREWYAREEQRIMAEYAKNKDVENKALVSNLVGTDLMQ